MSEILLLTPNQTMIDPEVQRGLDENRAQRIADDFNDIGFGVPVVSLRATENGSQYVVLDGQHRIEGARRAGRGDETFRMEVLSGLSRQDEALVFRVRNNTSKPTPVDTFKVALIEGRPEERSIARILATYGWKVENGGAYAAVQSVAALREVFRRDADRHGVSTGSTLNVAVRVLTNAWGLGQNSLAATILLGVAGLVRQHPRIDTEMLSKVLESIWQKPENLITQARSYKDVSGGSSRDAAATVITNAYNRRVRRSDRKLKDWALVKNAKTDLDVEPDAEPGAEADETTADTGE